jgi:hypothetical protein
MSLESVSLGRNARSAASRNAGLTRMAGKVDVFMVVASQVVMQL